jgi:hypothetical protein
MQVTYSQSYRSVKQREAPTKVLLAALARGWSAAPSSGGPGSLPEFKAQAAKVSGPSMKRVFARKADRRLAKSFLRGVSGGRVRRHGGLAGA